MIWVMSVRKIFGCARKSGSQFCNFLYRCESFTSLWDCSNPLSMVKKRNKEYYTVFSGRVDEPTIFSSWYSTREWWWTHRANYSDRGDAHPRVTNCPAVHEAFFTIGEAREYMMRKGVPECKGVVKAAALDTTPERSSMAYYAVAHGANPGIRGA